MNEAEKNGLRTHLQKGGSSSSTTSGARDWTNLAARMAEVLPDARGDLDAAHPVFHCFDIDTLITEATTARRSSRHLRGQRSEKALLAVANYNHDLGELWEFSDTGWVPVDVSNEAYKYGVNYVIYAMTH
jgi:hypothetical protein